jgi:hypothetical protein
MLRRLTTRLYDNAYLLLSFMALCRAGNQVLGRAVAGHICSTLRQSDVRSSPSASATWYPFRIVQAAGDATTTVPAILASLESVDTRRQMRDPSGCGATIGAGTVGRAESRRESPIFEVLIWRQLRLAVRGSLTRRSYRHSPSNRCPATRV